MQYILQVLLIFHKVKALYGYAVYILFFAVEGSRPFQYTRRHNADYDKFLRLKIVGDEQYS